MKFPEKWSELNVVLSHDWLTGMRGGERVLEILCRGFPRAPLVTLLHTPGTVSDPIAQRPIVTSWLNRLPGVGRYYRACLPFFTGAADRLAVPPCDLVLSTSHCVAKGVKPPVGARHLCYCFTPVRYAWVFEREYFGRNPVLALLARPILARLRRWDAAACSRVDRFVAISQTVRDRIKTFYSRDADIVYPPVNTDQWTPGKPGDRGFDLVVSALVPYKRVDLAVQTYSRLGTPLKVVGGGGELKRLKAMAASNIQFLGPVPDTSLLELYRTCRLLVFPGLEDFGIVPLEAQACGKPVVAYGQGGALETVREHVSGIFFSEQTEDSLCEALTRCGAHHWDPDAIRANAERFSIQHFIDALARSIDACLAGD